MVEPEGGTIDDEGTPLESIPLRVANTLSSEDSNPSNRSVLGDSRSVVGIPLSSDRMLLDRVTGLVGGMMNELDRESNPTPFAKSASTELELPLRRKVGGLDADGPTPTVSGANCSRERRLDKLGPLSGNRGGVAVDTGTLTTSADAPVLAASPQLDVASTALGAASSEFDVASIAISSSSRFGSSFGDSVSLDESGGVLSCRHFFFERFFGLRGGDVDAERFRIGSVFVTDPPDPDA